MGASEPPLEPLVGTLRFLAALGIGVLLGLERERAKPEASFAGVRTFGLIALAGGLAAFADESLDRPWLGLVLFAALAGLVIVSYRVTAERGELGITTEVSALVAFLLGFLCLRGYVTAAAGLAVASAAVLELKDWLHQLSARIERADIEATLKFAIVSVIILPIVPDQNFGVPPLDVINPYQIWLMVVLISAINFVSYLLVKILGTEHAIGLTGLLGGLVSSTAVTLGLSQRSREQRTQATPLALGILLAWTVMFLRIMVLVAVVDVRLIRLVGPSIAVLGGLTLGIGLLLWRRQHATQTTSVSAGENPFELREAIRFGLLFGVIVVGTKAAKVYLGDAGLYLAAAVAGLADVDPTVLSMAQLALAEPANAEGPARGIVIAVAANTLFKAGMALVLGAPELKTIIAGVAGVILVGVGIAVWLI
jgi:uncharacterized membrane protein (DUF4010 family)